MAFREHKMGFREADCRYAELKQQYDAGSISDGEFDEQRRQLMVQDDEGRWWAKSRNTGEWHYHDGAGWVQDTPPEYRQPQTLPEDSMLDLQPWPDQGEQLPPSRTTLPGSAPVQDQNGEQPRRGVSRWLLIAVVLLMVVALAGIGTVAILGGEEGDVASGYLLFAHDTGALSVEVPSEWDERVVVDSEGEKGRSSWSSFLGEGENIGPSLTAVNDLYSWRNGTSGHQGVYMVASKKLAQGYTDDKLVNSGPNDYSSSCEPGAVQDFDRSPYSGKILEWANCSGDSEHTAITLAAAPQDRECVVVAQIGGYFQDDEESIQHVLDTFKADCGKIE
jgi:hypothetical protein